jgi:nucleotide-binding universal stress UspA family protein
MGKISRTNERWAKRIGRRVMIDTMLVATDDSSTAMAAAEYAADIATCEGSKVVVLSVVHPHLWGDTTTFDDRDEFVRMAREAVDKTVDALKAQGIDATGRTWESETEHVQEAIEQVAEEIGADLIVMGTHGRTGLDRALLGSVADRVLRSSKVPLLVIPSTYVGGKGTRVRETMAAGKTY